MINFFDAYHARAPCQQCWSFRCGLAVSVLRIARIKLNFAFFAVRGRYFGSLRVPPRPSMVNIFVACHDQAPCQQCWSFWCSLVAFLCSKSLEPSWNLPFLLPVKKPRSRYFGSLRVPPRPSMINIFVAYHTQAHCQHHGAPLPPEMPMVGETTVTILL